MRIRQRLMLMLVSTTAFLIFILYSLSSAGMMSSFDALEQKEVKRNVARVQGSFDQMVQDLHSKSSDWSSWGDSYQFMADHNQDFIKSNLDVVNMKVDAIVFVGNDGKIFHARPIFRSKDLPLPNPESLVSSLRFVRHVDGVNANMGASAGLVLHNNIPMIVSIRPILPAAGQGIQRGWIIFGAYIRDSDVKSIAERAQIGVELISPKNSAAMSVATKEAISYLKSSNDIIARPKDSDQIHGYAYLKDVNRKAIRVIQTNETRDIHAQGQEETQFLVKIMAYAGIAFSLGVLLVIERTILTRLALLAKQLDIIRSESDLTQRVATSGQDELTTVSNKINEMLSGIEVNTNLLKLSEDKLRIHSENLESTVLVRTQEIEHLAYHDKLTGLPNRSLVLERIDLALTNDFQNSRGTAVMFVDLDNFKLVNDSLGHPFGDALLIEITRVLSESVRPGDTVARIGGDEFTILLEDIESVEVAEQVARQILSGLKTPIHLGNRETYASASIGIVYTNGEKIDSATLVKHADTAMYRAKAAGKSNFVTYDESMHDHAIDRLELETSLRKALSNGEIFVEYQPLIDLVTNEMIGAEALARWEHPDRGLVSPGMFIPIAEETGLILPIGYWILEQACLQAKLWTLMHSLEHFVMSVNLSGKQLQRDDVVDRIRAILESTELPPHQLKLEITESILMEDRAEIIEKMVALKSLGVQLALDDFGTGYSSLSTLRLFPIDTLKIDRAFISRLGEEESALPIVEAILGLARTMQMTVTGEGVENIIQQDIIRELGCQVGQGYYYDKPLGAKDFGKRISKSKKASKSIEKQNAA